MSERAGWIARLGCWAIVAASLWVVRPALAQEPPSSAPAAPDPGAEPSVDDAELARLIEQLGHERFFVREQAQAALAKLGYEAFDALAAAQDHEDIEIASRAKYLVRLIRVEWTRDGDPPALKQLLDGYDQLDQPNRGERIKRIAANTEGPWVGALCRVARFERFPALSKQAAVLLIEQPDLPADAWPARGEVILSQVGRSARPAAEWLRCYVAANQDAAGALERWRALVDAEEQTLAQCPEETDDAILGALVRYHIALLERLGRQEEINGAIARLVATESGETESLVKLVDWLIQRKAWEGLDQLHARFSNRFEQDAKLAYSLAGARLVREDSPGAEKLAAQALALNPGENHQHLQIAVWLREKGWPEWSERELRRVIEIGPPDNNDTLTAQFRLAELLHDRQADDAAGLVLEQALAGLDKAAQAANRQPEFAKALDGAKRWISSRMHYYRACHFQRQQDRAKEAEELAAGIKDDPTDADILIALYRLPEQSESQRTETKKLIDDAALKFRAQIAQNPAEANGYNQLAWLLSNTDRELEEALKASQESLRLRPNEAGYLDTLGRCYYALKDYENAVKYQEQAVAGEPHSGQMKRQLEIFRQALAAARGESKS
ncbi:MAG: hypothetical protein JNG90_04070 [Planctomycetaceae bacterium]|nr:hypothetical protein [Planctomycetaceae bacterium]